MLSETPFGLFGLHGKAELSSALSMVEMYMLFVLLCSRQELKSSALFMSDDGLWVFPVYVSAKKVFSVSSPRCYWASLISMEDYIAYFVLQLGFP